MGVYNYDAINDELVPIAGTSAEQGLSDKVSKYSADSTYWDTTPTSSSTKPVTSGGILADINSKVSHENLLDNPWFTVNQRGFTSSSTLGYPADRWNYVYNPDGCTITRNGNLLEIDNTQSGATNSYLFQLTDNKELVGKTVIGSVMLSDGTILKGTVVVPALDDGNTPNIFVDSTRKFRVYVQHTTTGSRGLIAFAFEFNANCSISIKATKLELGTVSTLAMDTAPNYQQELAKCQRYFQKLDGGLTYIPLGKGFTTNTSSCYVDLRLAVPMRINPTINISAGILIILGNGQWFQEATFTVYNDSSFSPVLKRIRIEVSTVTLTQNAIYQIELQTTSAGTEPIIELSADL